MATLYDLQGIFLDIYQMDIDDETKADTLESIEWQEDFVQKVDAYVKVLKNLEGDEKALDEEIQRLNSRKQSIKKKKDHLKLTLQTAMEVTGNERVTTPLFSVVVSNNKPRVIVDEEKLASRYKIKTVTVKPDKNAIYEQLKEGKKVHGAKLEESRSLRIR